MHSGGCQIDDNFLSRNVETFGLQGRYRPKEALLYCGIGQTHQMDSYSQADLYFYHDGHGLYTHALCSMNVYQHRRNILPASYDNSGKLIG